nr:285_t:CDS:2 [Entrophospora candida]
MSLNSNFKSMTSCFSQVDEELLLEKILEDRRVPPLYLSIEELSESKKGLDDFIERPKRPINSFLIYRKNELALYKSKNTKISKSDVNGIQLKWNSASEEPNPLVNNNTTTTSLCNMNMYIENNCSSQDLTNMRITDNDSINPTNYEYYYYNL